MIRKTSKVKSSKIEYPVHEHLEHWVKKTTYKDRLKWLQDANEFVRKAGKSKVK